MRQLWSPVLYSSALEVALTYSGGEDGEDAEKTTYVSTLLEVGASPVLTRMAQSWAGKIVKHPLVWHASLDRKAELEDMQVLERTTNAIEAARGNRKGLFPNVKSFPWQPLAHPLLQHSTAPSDQESQFVAVFHSSLMDLMQDHTIHGRTLFPGAGFVEMALAAQLGHMGKHGDGGV